MSNDFNDFKGNNLKLIGKNQNDLKVISAHSQDSIVTVKDMVFLKKKQNFYYDNKPIYVGGC